MSSDSQRCTRRQVLIVDEVSMLDGALMDKLDYIGRSIKSQPHQVLVSGPRSLLPPPALHLLSLFSALSCLPFYVLLSYEFIGILPLCNPHRARVWQSN